MPYLVVKETGEYSGFDYEPICVCGDVATAEKKVESLTKQMNRQREINYLYNRWIQEFEYVIHHVEEVNNCDDECDANYEVELERATEWRKKYDEEKKEQENKKNNERLQLYFEEINDFIEWMELHGHKNVEKKQTKINAITPKMEYYLANRNNQRIASMFRQIQPNHILTKLMTRGNNSTCDDAQLDLVN